MIASSYQKHFYWQEYCGCPTSLCDTNLYSIASSSEPIARGARLDGIVTQAIPMRGHEK